MSKLATLGSKIYRAPKIVIATWLVFVAVLVGVVSQQEIKTTEGISIPGTPAQVAIDELSDKFPDAGKGTGRVVLKMKSDKDITTLNDKIDTLSQDLTKVDGVNDAIAPSKNLAAISEDKRVAFITVQLANGQGNVEEKTISSIEDAVNEFASKNNNEVQVERGGDIINQAPSEILGIGEAFGVLIALLVLVVTLGTLISAGMPVIVALMAVGVSMLALFSLSSVIDITSTTPTLAVMLGLAVGIDYSLFILSKYRSYLNEGYTAEESIEKTLATAGNAVIFAALTVVIALAALSVVNIPFMTTMGLAGAATVAVAALAAVTLLPALMTLGEKWILPKKERKHVEKLRKKKKHDKHGVVHKDTTSYKIGYFITHKPWISMLVGIAIIIAIAWPVGQLKLGLPSDQYAAEDATQRKAYDILADAFGPGFNGPLLVLTDNVTPVSDEQVEAKRKDAMAELNKTIADKEAEQTIAFQKKIQQASSPQEMQRLQQEAQKMQKEGEKQKQAAMNKINEQLEMYKKYGAADALAKKIEKKYDSVSSAQPALVSDDGKTVALQVMSKYAPSDDKTISLIDSLRDETLKTDNNELSLKVTGSAALENDINKKLTDALPIYLLVVVGLSLIILVIAFRSILIPIKATLGFLLSVAAMFGAITAIFQFGWFGIADAPGPIVSFVPIIGIGILFGLAMDYEFFLVSSMHESYTSTGDTKHAIVNGYALGAKVVAAAALIMVAVFAAFIFNHDKTIQSIGLGLAIGVAIDAFVVRMLIVPAVMQLLGKSAWWIPSWLDSILPHIDIEGSDALDTEKS